MRRVMNFVGCNKDLVLQQQHHHHHHQEVNINGDDMHSNSNKSCSSSSRSWESGGGEEESKWAQKLLRECARAISEGESARVQQLLWMLNELASPYGDREQKLASYFLQALFCRATRSGRRCYHTLSSMAHTSSFDSARRLILKFQEVSPWTTFGHVASNGAILEALDGHPRLHIIDIMMGNTLLLCTQWPTLLEALATRNVNDDTPHLKLTLLLTTTTTTGGGGGSVEVVRQRMEKFARLMGVPFQLNIMAISSSGGLLNGLTKEALGVDEEEEEAVAVNCVGALRRVRVEERAGVIAMLRSLNPKVVTLVEEEADMCTNRGDFVNAFDECLRFFSLYFDTLEESFGATSNERLMLERDSSRSIVRVLACTDDEDGGRGRGRGDHNHNNNHEEEGGGGEWEEEEERRERGRQWGERMKQQEFRPLPFSDDVLDDVKALLKRYRHGNWSLSPPHVLHHHGIYLHWKDHPVLWASAWKP